MDSNQDARENPNLDEPSSEQRSDAQPADEFIASHQAVAEEAGSPEPPADRPSRTAAWLAMGAVALALALIWIAPGVGDRTEPASQSSTTTGEAASENPGDPDDADATGKVAPLQFTLKDMNGVDVKLAAFKGKPIVINFWATWCGPCRAEIPSLVQLQQQYGDEGQDVVILGISVDDPIEKLKPYASEMKINYPLLVGNGREDVQEAFGPLWGIPVTVFVDREGRIAKRHSGIASKEQFEREIKALL